MGQLSLSATVTEDHALYALCSTREATAMRRPHTTTKSSPRLPQLEKARAQQQDPEQPEITNQLID